MTQELVEKLLKAGFPLETSDNSDYGWGYMVNGVIVSPPTLSELLEACGDRFDALETLGGEHKWGARGGGEECHCDTPEEAVANLYLALHK